MNNVPTGDTTAQMLVPIMIGLAFASFILVGVMIVVLKKKSS